MQLGQIGDEGGGQARIANADRCVVYGPGLQGGSCGERLEVMVKTYDAFGIALGDSGASVRAGINTESGRTYIEDCEDGTYRVICMCTKPGAVELHISVDGNPLKNSPFGIALTPGPAVPRMSVLRGDLQTLGRGQVIKDTNE